MENANRLGFSIHSRSTRVVISWLLAASTSLLVATSANAVLHEYRLSFEPSASEAAAGYTLHVGLDSGSYPVEFDLGNPPASGGTIVYAVDLDDASDLFVALRAYDAFGELSSFSNEVRVSAAVIAEPAPEPTPEPTPEPAPSDGTGGDPTTPPVEESPSEPLPPVDISDLGVGLVPSADGRIEILDADGTRRLLTLDSLASLRDLRPTRCDLDGDGDMDLVIGFGPGSAGQLSILHLEDGHVHSVRSLEAGNGRYQKRMSGMTHPSCGDLDGDGLAEIAVGFDADMRGYLQIFDDESTGFASFSSSSLSRDGYLRVSAGNVSLFPAMGDIDGDGRDELVVGTGPGRDVGLKIFDDATKDFVGHAALEMGGNSIDVMPLVDGQWLQDVSRHVAVGDVDGDGFDEIVVSFSAGSQGQVMVLDDARAGFVSAFGSRLLAWFQAGRETYRELDGETQVALGDLDLDGREELIVGFRRSGQAELQIFDDVVGKISVGQIEPLYGAEGFISTGPDGSPVFPHPVR